jgi:hypothetical protein
MLETRNGLIIVAFVERRPLTPLAVRPRAKPNRNLAAA